MNFLEVEFSLSVMTYRGGPFCRNNASIALQVSSALLFGSFSPRISPDSLQVVDM